MRLIDADALAKELAEDMKYDCSYYHDWPQKETRDAKYSFAIDRIASAPTIDAVPVVHGRWVEVAGCRTICNHCGEYPLYDYFGRQKLSNTCPNCGARMDGEADV
jgi:hypothetical protein